MPDICIIEPSLQNKVGHFFEYSSCLYEEARRRNHGFVCLGNRRAANDVRAALPIEAVFRYGLFDPVWRRRPFRYFEPLPANVAFYQDLTTALIRCASRKSILFMPTVGHRELLGFWWWYRQQPIADKPKLVLLFRMNDYFDSLSGRWRIRNAFWIKLGFWMMEREARHGMIRITVDSERLAREFSRITHLPIEVFPIPHTRTAQTQSRQSALADNGKLRMVFLGNARRDKGFSVLARALKMLADELKSGQLEAVIQCNLFHPDAETLQAREMLTREGLPNVLLIAEPLSTEGYYGLLDSSDVVVIPYRRASYYARTSGVLAEAIAAGKPVIVPHDTWMSDQVEHRGGGVLFSDGNAADLARAVRQTMAEYSRLQSDAENHATAWCRFHNPANLYEMLIKE